MPRLHYALSRGWYLLALAALGPSPAWAAQGPPATGTLRIEVVSETGAPLAGVDILTIVNGQKQPRGTTGGSGTSEFDVAVLNLGKGTPVRVVVVRCGEEIEIQLVPPNEKERCEDERDPQKKCECREAGLILWGSGRLRVRVTPTGATATFIPDPTEGAGAGPSVEFTLLGAWKRSMFTNLDEAEGTITGRYQTANYNQFQTDVVDSDHGFGVGGTVRIMFGAIGVMGGYAWQDLGAGEVHTNGTRAAGNLAFRLDSVFEANAHKVMGGVVLGPPRFLVIPYYGRAFWSIDRTIRDELRASGVQVSGGERSDERDGSGQVFGARVEAYVSRLIGGYVEIERVDLDEAFEPDGPDAFPADVTNTNVIVGIVVRLPLRR